MIIKFEFDTENTEHNREYKLCSKAEDMALALWDITNIRKELEKTFESRTENFDVFDGINAFSEEIINILNNYSINIDELIN